MDRYKVRLEGESPLLLHHDNLAWDEKMRTWMKDPANKQESVAGDDRTPAWRWIGYLYTGGGLLVMPADNLMTVMREGGKKCSTGKGQQTFKSQTQSGIMVDQGEWPLEVNGQHISYSTIKELIDVKDFSKHLELAESLGFELFVKRAKVGANKHVRVRPRFDTWACEGTLTILDESITEHVLQNILTMAGRYSGLGDWRPSAPKSPGPFGRFTASITKL